MGRMRKRGKDGLKKEQKGKAAVNPELTDLYRVSVCAVLAQMLVLTKTYAIHVYHNSVTRL